MTAIQLIDKLIEERQSEPALCERLREIRQAIIDAVNAISGAVAQIDHNILRETKKNEFEDQSSSFPAKQRERSAGIYERKTPSRF